jgi:hypothetical protein
VPHDLPDLKFRCPHRRLNQIPLAILPTGIGKRNG